MDLALRRVQADLRDTFAKHPALPKSLPLDRWLASSLMQKAIRRGETQIAQAAAYTYFCNDPTGVWRRLMVVAYEDIAATAQDVLIETVVICSDSTFRRSVGAVAALHYLCERLANAPKERSSDYLICSAKDHPALEPMREECGAASIEKRISMAGDPNFSLPERATAAWYASGLEWRPEQRVGKGDLLSLIEHFQSLGMDRRLAAATHLAASRTREPIIVMAPLLNVTIGTSGPVRLVSHRFSASSTHEGIPLYALDRHTRLGKQAMRQLIFQDKQLQKHLEQWLPDRHWLEAVSLAAFYVDAVPTTPHLHWSETSALIRMGIETDFCNVGLSYEQGQYLIQGLKTRLIALNRLRRRELTNYCDVLRQERQEMDLG